MTDKEKIEIPAAMETMMNYLGVDIETSCDSAVPVVARAISTCLTCPAKHRCLDHTNACSVLCPNTDRFRALPHLAYWPEWLKRFQT